MMIVNYKLLSEYFQRFSLVNLNLNFHSVKHGVLGFWGFGVLG